MKSLFDLQVDTGINITVAGAKIEANYPDNEWGIILAHFDSCVAVFRHAKVETKKQGLQRSYVNSQAKNENDGSWDSWNEDNPDIPVIPHNPVIYNASVNACTYFAEPPPPLRDCLSVLANGGVLSNDDRPYFLLMYGEFRAHLSILHARDPEIDELERLRRARKNNNDHLMRYAARFLTDELQAHDGLTMEAARNVFTNYIDRVVDGKTPPPEGWAREDFQKFLDKPDKNGPRLKKQYGQDLTETQLKNWL